jgi:hypothetical protein
VLRRLRMLRFFHPVLTQKIKNKNKLCNRKRVKKPQHPKPPQHLGVKIGSNNVVGTYFDAKERSTRKL